MISVICRILSRDLSIDANRSLVCTWSLSRGFIEDAYWHLGVAGYSELGNTTVLG